MQNNIILYQTLCPSQSELVAARGDQLLYLDSNDHLQVEVLRCQRGYTAALLVDAPNADDAVRDALTRWQQWVAAQSLPAPCADADAAEVLFHPTLGEALNALAWEFANWH